MKTLILGGGQNSKCRLTSVYTDYVYTKIVQNATPVAQLLR